MAKAADVYFQVDPWKVIEQGFDPAYARVSESIFSLGNESIGVRGCFDEGGHVDSLRGAYTNGIYDMEKLNRSYKGIIDKTHFMIPSAEWLMTTISVDGETLDLGHAHPPLPLDDEERQANPPDLPPLPRYGPPRTRVPAHHARSAQFHGQRDSHVRRVLRRRA
mgnify:CR=1 FL=1